MTSYPAMLLTLLFVFSGGRYAGLPATRPALSEAPEPPILFCSLDRPVIEPAGIVKASVIADTSDPDKVAYQWKAAGGAFLVSGQEPSTQSSGKEVQWTARGAASGAHQLLGAARSSTGSAGSCALTVIVSASERGNRESSIQDLARAFLARDALEGNGYGLYSYLVLPDECISSQSGTSRERCNIFVRAALLHIREEKDMKDADVVPLEHLNITYFLVKHAIPSDITADLDRHLDDQVRWILTNYDYARCHKLLLLLRDPLTRPGPIVISTRDPVFRSSAHDPRKPAPCPSDRQ